MPLKANTRELAQLVKDRECNARIRKLLAVIDRTEKIRELARTVSELRWGERVHGHIGDALAALRAALDSFDKENER